jgi:flagellar motor switch protein FliM
MSEVLSQSEIDNLLAAVEIEDFGGDNNNEPSRILHKCETMESSLNNNHVKMYDFKRPDKFSKDQIRTIQMIHEVFARLTTTYLSGYLDTFVNVHVASVDQITYEEFTRSIPNPTTLAPIHMDPLKGSAIIEIDPTITFAILDLLYGGEGESLKNNRKLTDIEQSIMEGTVIRMLGNLREAWVPIIDLRPKLGEIENNIQFAQIVPPNNMCILITLETRIGDVESMMNMCIPYITIESIMHKLTATNWYASKLPEIDDNINTNLMQNIKEVTIDLKYNMGNKDMSLEELAKLKVGDTVNFKHNPIITSKTGVPLFEFEPVTGNESCIEISSGLLNNIQENKV